MRDPREGFPSTRQAHKQKHRSLRNCKKNSPGKTRESEGLRRLLVNAVYWGAGLPVPAEANVSYVGAYRPTMYGFDGHIKGVKPASLR